LLIIFALVPFKRNANVSVDRLLRRITSIGLSPYGKNREIFGTQIRHLRINVIAPEDMDESLGYDERAPLAARLSEYLSLGHFEDLSSKIDDIEICVDQRRAYHLSNDKNYFKLEWSHKWRRDSAMEE